MKTKISFLLIAVICVAVSATAKPKKPKKVFKYKLEMVSTPSDKGKDITFYCSISDRAFKEFVDSFTVINGTDKRIYIEWENARFKDSKVVFGSDSKLTMRNPKADEAVSAKSKSIQQSITSLAFLDGESGGAWAWAGYKGQLLPFIELKKNPGKTASLDILIPIKYEDNSVEDFKLRITGWYEEKDAE